MRSSNLKTLLCGVLVVMCVAVVILVLGNNANANLVGATVLLENMETVTVSEEETENENPFHCAVMVFTPEEAQDLLDRFEAERIAAEEAARKAAEEAAAKEAAAKAAKARAGSVSASGLTSYYAGALSYTENDVFMLATIIGQETAGEDEEIALAVGNVVINRINDPRFPNNMYDVLTARLQYGHDNGEGFYFNSYVTAEGRELCLRVARRLLEGERVLPSNVVWQAGFPQGEGVYIYYDTYPYGTYLCY